jgi:transcription elongation factor Elf1
MKNSLETNKIELSLVERLQTNAMDSLVHGIEHFIHGQREYDHKYVILHVFHAVELLLKARLAKHNEKLIYRDPKSGFTVSCDTALNLLIKEANVNLKTHSKQDKNGNYQLDGKLKRLKEYRNNIEHKELVVSADDVKILLGEVFNFLEEFVIDELGLDLKNLLDELDDIRKDELEDQGRQKNCVHDEEISSYQMLSMACLFYYRHMRDEGISSYKDVDFQTFTCEFCEKEAVAYPDPTLDHSFQGNHDLLHCFHCGEIYSVSICSRCEAVSVSPTSSIPMTKANQSVNISAGNNKYEDNDDFDGCFCDNCMDWIGDQ